jgi:hypothetical protein
MRPRGLEPPRTIQSTRPSTLIRRCTCVEGRPERPFCDGSSTHGNHWTIWTLPKWCRGSPCGFTAKRRPSRRRGLSLAEAPGARGSLPGRGRRPHLSPLDTACAGQGTAARVPSPRRRSGVTRAASRTSAQQRTRGLASYGRAAGGRLRAPRRRRSPGRPHRDDLAAALAYGHADRRALRP